MNWGFNKKYFVGFVLLFLVEACIALFVNDRFVRPFVGDVIVVWLVFAFARSFYAGGKDWQIAAGVFLFAALVELGQYLDLISRFGLRDSHTVRIVLGSTFDWKDILAYGVGAACIVLARRASAGRGNCPASLGAHSGRTVNDA